MVASRRCLSGGTEGGTLVLESSDETYEPEALDGVLYRVGDDPLHDRLLTPKEARLLMERKGLAADFFAGRPIEAGPVMVPRR